MEGDEEEEAEIDIDDPVALAARGLKRVTVEGENEGDEEEYLLDNEGNLFNLKGEYIG
jgi:hypothetical protein